MQISSANLYGILYVEINLFCVLLMEIILRKTAGLTRMVAQRNFAMAIRAQMVFFLTDTFSAMLVSGIFPYSKAGILIAKELYFFSTTLMCFFWFVYFEYRQDSPFVENRKRVLYSSVLVWLMGVLLIANLFTGILFYVDADGVYRRGQLFIIQYLLSYVYVFFTCSRAFVESFKTENYAKKRLLRSLAFFPVAPAGAGILQFIWPQLPLACVSLTAATLLLYFNWLDQMISLDPLTHLNNRKQLEHSFDQWCQGHSDKACIHLLLFDVNKFKSINDTYGHVQGDAALIRVADALRLGCRTLSGRAVIARYGGDEFVIMISQVDEGEIAELKKNIHECLAGLNRKANVPYALSISIGVASGNGKQSLKELVEKADQMMYEEKAKTSLN